MHVRKPPSAVVLSSCHRGSGVGALSSNIQDGQSSPRPLLWPTSRPIKRKCLHASAAFPSAAHPWALWRGRPGVLQPSSPLLYTLFPFPSPLQRELHVVSSCVWVCAFDWRAINVPQNEVLGFLSFNSFLGIFSVSLFLTCS